MKKICAVLVCLALLLCSLPQAPAVLAAEDVNTLQSLTVESVVCDTYGDSVVPCGIYPEFSSDRTDSVVDVAYGVKEVRIAAQPASATADLQINGESAAAGVASAVYGQSLEVGDNIIPIRVTAESGSQRTYTLHVKRVGDQYALPQTPQDYQNSPYACYARRLATGQNHSLALKKDGTVVAWGYNDKGQCNVPSGLTGVIALAAGLSHSLALKSDGTVVAWGKNTVSKYNNGQCNVPKGLNQVVAVSAGREFSAALKSDGTVVVWGDNSKGQCNVPAGLNESGDVVDIKCGSFKHMLALKKDGTVVAWGDNSKGQCSVPEGLGQVVAISAGFYDGMALKADGTVVAWGKYSDGTDFKNLNLQYVSAIAAGSSHAAALKWDGSLAVWGDYYSQNVDLGVPLDLGRVLAVSSNYDHLLALHQDGTVTAWGVNSNGRCDVPQGLNLLEEDPPPYSGPAPNIPQTPAAYAASDYARAAARIKGIGDGAIVVLNIDGTVKVWSSNDNELTSVPPDLNNVKKIAVTGFFVMALEEDGTVVVWGHDGSNACIVPENLGVVKDIAANLHVNDSYCLALKEDGTVAAWGENPFGQLDVPEGLSGVKSIAAGWDHCLALKEDGTVAAWGENDQGQCNVPAGLADVNCVYAGADFSVALKEDGTVAAWGKDDLGQCDVPQGLNNVVDICINDNTCMALRGNGTVAVWGDNSNSARNVPPGLHDVAAVCGGCLAVKTDGAIVAWGDISGMDEEKLVAETNVLTISGKTVIYRDGTLKNLNENSDIAEPMNNFLAGLNVLFGHPLAITSVGLFDPSGNSIGSVAGRVSCRVNAGIANNCYSPREGLVIIQVRGGEGATAAGGGRVLGCAGQTGQIPVEGSQLGADFVMPENLPGPAYVDVFVWDGWNKMTPLSDANQTLSFTITE